MSIFGDKKSKLLNSKICYLDIQKSNQRMVGSIALIKNHRDGYHTYITIKGKVLKAITVAITHCMFLLHDNF